MKDKKFLFTHYITQASPLVVDFAVVHATALFDDSGNVSDVKLDDIKYKGQSFLQLCSVISPDFIEECTSAALEMAKDTMGRCVEEEA